MTDSTFAEMAKFDTIHADALVDGTWEAEVYHECLPYFGKGETVEDAIANACIAAVHQIDLD